MAFVVRLRQRNAESNQTLTLKMQNYETKETLTIRAPSSSSLIQLQEILFNALPPNPLYVSPSSLHFSIDGNSLLLDTQKTLKSLYLSSGRLVYFSFNPETFSSYTSESLYMWEEEFIQQEEPMWNEPRVSQATHQGTEFMDAHAFSVMVSAGELLGGDNNRCMHDLLLVAVHSILSDSGFVLIDPISGLKKDRFHLPDEWLSSSFCYSLPQLFKADEKLDPRFTDHIVLKFQSLSNFFQVYGSLAKGGSGSGSGLYRISLDENKFSPALALLWEHCRDGSINPCPKTELLKLWMIVKDELALPLLMDLSNATGLALPACLMSLTPDLKLKILESLPGTDIARMESVSSEMRILASNEDLWKKKVVEVFGARLGNWLGGEWKKWKKVYHVCWLSRKKRKRVIPRWQAFPVPEFKRDKYGVYVIYDDNDNTVMRRLSDNEE